MLPPKATLPGRTRPLRSSDTCGGELCSFCRNLCLLKSVINQPGAVVHTCNLNSGRLRQEDFKRESHLDNVSRPVSKLKIRGLGI